MVLPTYCDRREAWGRGTETECNVCLERIMWIRLGMSYSLHPEKRGRRVPEKSELDSIKIHMQRLQLLTEAGNMSVT